MLKMTSHLMIRHFVRMLKMTSHLMIRHFVIYEIDPPIKMEF